MERHAADESIAAVIEKPSYAREREKYECAEKKRRNIARYPAQRAYIEHKVVDAYQCACEGRNRRDSYSNASCKECREISLSKTPFAPQQQVENNEEYGSDWNPLPADHRESDMKDASGKQKGGGGGGYFRAKESFGDAIDEEYRERAEEHVKESCCD